MVSLSPYVGSLPMAPGKSPFSIKGLGYLTMIEEARQEIPGGFPALRATLADPTLIRFFEQTFLAVGFYDALPILPISVAMCRARNMPYAECVRQRAERRAQHDLQLYRAIFRTLSMDQAFAGLMKIWPRYFGFGSVTMHCLRPGHWEVHLDDLPALLVPWFLPMTEGYISAVLRAANIAKPVLHPVQLPTMPSPPSLELTRLRLDVTF
jgi:hypothetical protein